MKYFLHRISHEWQASYPLLENGLLSIGWSDFSEREFVDDVRRGKEFLDKRLEVLKDPLGKLPRNRNCLYRFIVEMDRRDIILVPKPKFFSIYRVVETAVPVSEINLPKNLYSEDGKPITIQKGLIYKGNESVDLGFIIRVELIAKDVSRYEYADAALTARMRKVRFTNACIDDLKGSVQNVILSFNNGNEK
ncbi:hypothetical protein [Helicobacter sp.]|uniref:hypothetical protein n=1 Tax=Helicobacter sp. TaxID=218 RepID=UPI00199F9A17|nr:hypothetical protein [Helicobacter sp.]MBD5164973.1 hypothetical protein [Helicobacter sp.]